MTIPAIQRHSPTIGERFQGHVHDMRSNVQERTKKIYQKFRSTWSKIGRGILVMRKGLQAASKIVSPNTSHFKRIQLVIGRSKLFTLISIPLNLHGMVNETKSIHHSRKQGDHEGMALGILGQIGSGLGMMDSINTAFEGFVSIFTISNHVQSTVSFFAKPLPFINMGIAGIGAISRSIQMDLARRDLNRIEVIEAQSKNPAALIPLLQSMLGVTEAEEAKIVEKVQAVSQKKFRSMDGLKREEKEKKLLEKLKERVIYRKEKGMERATNRRAVELMKQVMKGSNDSEHPPEKILSEMKTVIQRKIALQSVQIGRNLTTIGAISLFFAPITPVVPLIAIATLIASSIVLDLAENRIVYRGLTHLTTK